MRERLLAWLALGLSLLSLAPGCGREISADAAGRGFAATPDTTPGWTPPTAGGLAASGTVYETAEQLVRKSDLIVVGTVERSVIGEVQPAYPGDEYPTRTVHTTVSIEEALKGAASQREVSVPTLELAFGGPGGDWREPGQRVLLFLTPSPEKDEPFYILANVNYMQTTYFVDGDDIEPGIRWDVTGVSERVAAMTVPELRQLVERVTD